MSSVLIVLAIFFVFDLLLRCLDKSKHSLLRLVFFALGGALPFGLLAGEIIERDSIAVILSLAGFVYFAVKW